MTSGEMIVNVVLGIFVYKLLVFVAQFIFELVIN